MSRCIATALATAALGALLTASADASLIFHDPFATGGAAGSGQYSSSAAGVNLTGQNPAIAGFSGAWITGYGSPFEAVNSGLTYAGAPSSGGSAETNDGGVGRSTRVLSSAFTDSTTGTYYLGFLYKNINLSSGHRAFEFHNGTSNDADRVLGVAGGTGTGTSRSKLFAPGKTDVFSSPSAANNNVHLVVLKLVMSSTAASDEVTFFYDPADVSSEAGSTAAGTMTGLNLRFDRMSFGTSGSASIAFDEIRMGTTWADATGVPEPSTALLAAAALPLVARRRRVTA
jgi:hypothetical protein